MASIVESDESLKSIKSAIVPTFISCFSPNLNCHIGIGFLKAGDTRIGEVVRLVSPLTGQDHNVQVVSAHFIDPEGERLRA